MSSQMPFRINTYLRDAQEGRGAPFFVYSSPKEYPRMEQIALPEPVFLEVDLGNVLSQRVSHPAQILQGDMSLSALGSLFGHALRMRPDGTRQYPSGGGFYPIESYLITQTLPDLKSGAYHYHPRAHALEYLWDLPEDFTIQGLLRGGEKTESPALLIFTGIWDRPLPKYGDFGYLLGVLESGHMAQNILMVATALRLPACPFGGFQDAKVAEILDLDTHVEQPVHAIALGRKS